MCWLSFSIVWFYGDMSDHDEAKCPGSHFICLKYFRDALQAKCVAPRLNDPFALACSECVVLFIRFSCIIWKLIYWVHYITPSLMTGLHFRSNHHSSQTWCSYVKIKKKTRRAFICPSPFFYVRFQILFLQW